MDELFVSLGEHDDAGTLEYLCTRAELWAAIEDLVSAEHGADYDRVRELLAIIAVMLGMEAE